MNPCPGPKGVLHEPTRLCGPQAVHPLCHLLPLHRMRPRFPPELPSRGKSGLPRNTPGNLSSPRVTLRGRPRTCVVTPAWSLGEGHDEPWAGPIRTAHQATQQPLGLQS